MDVTSYTLHHNGRNWLIVRIGDSWFARQGGSDVGPYSTVEQAADWIRGIRP